MKLLLQYLERVTQLEKLASEETDPNFREQLFQQAASYRQLAKKRAQEEGLPLPSPPDHS